MYTVRWQKSARDELASLWLQADSALRKQITSASKQIEIGLRHDPSLLGEAREENDRVWFVSPLGVCFEIHDFEKIFRGLQVRSPRKRK